MKNVYRTYCDRLFDLGEKNKCILMTSLPRNKFFDLSVMPDALDFLNGKICSLSLTFNYDPEEKYYVGFPYLFLKRNEKISVQAPLLFFPVRITDGAVEQAGGPFPNRALFLISEKTKRKKLFDALSDAEHITTQSFLNLLEECGYTFERPKNDPLISFSEATPTRKRPQIKNVAVLGPFPAMTEMQEDYYSLQKKNLYNGILRQLLTGKSKKTKTLKGKTYLTEELDSSQKKAVLSGDKNIVLFGPPGTGKSQTIAGIIGNNLASGKKVLVVCQKKIALEVIFSRLKELKNKSFLCIDPKNEKSLFFDALSASYTHATEVSDNTIEKEYEKTEEELKKEYGLLEKLNDALQEKLPFGLTLQEMYELSCRNPETETERQLVEDFKETGLINLTYEKIVSDVNVVVNGKLTDKFIEYQKIMQNNDLACHIQDADVELLGKVKERCKIISTPFPFSETPYGRFILPYYLDGATIKKSTSMLFNYIHPHLKRFSFLSVFPLFFPILFFIEKRKKETEAYVRSFYEKFGKYESEFDPLKSFFEKDGYTKTICALSCGADLMPQVEKTVDNYLAIRTIKNVFSDLSPEIKSLLAYAYAHSVKTAESMNEILKKVIPVRVYYELLRYDPQAEKTLSLTKRHQEIVDHILALEKKLTKIGRSIALKKCDENYLSFHSSLGVEKKKEFIFAMKNHNKSVRECYFHYENFIMNLLPCLLTTPEVASKILPLQKDIFDVVIFDEASQLPMENALPSLYRGKTAIVSGDDKQLSPAYTFSRKISENETEIPESVQKARSLFDLAVTVFSPVSLKFHYRSEYRELIDFSNKYFYNEELFVAPNPHIPNNAPVEYVKVNGKRTKRKNNREADEIVRLASEYVKRYSVGIITLNAEQCDLIEEKMKNKRLFGQGFSDEQKVFVKSIENVQGEERDVILISVGYAPDENGRLFARYGVLGTEGGEKRLNVAVTRAKKKTVVVTSLEPEELPVASVKNEGPKMLKRFLEYAKTVSATYKNFNTSSVNNNVTEMEAWLVERLRDIGYDVRYPYEAKDRELAFAVYDQEQNRYLIGVETDVRAYRSGKTVAERDIDKPRFMRSKGWRVVRIWTRDLWLSPKNVLSDLCFLLEKERQSGGLSVCLNTSLSLSASIEVTQDRSGKIGKESVF